MQTITRRSMCIGTATLAGFAAFGARPPLAQELASLSLLVPSAPGGGFDQTARAMQAAIQTIGAAKAVQVDNLPGAAGMVALTALGRRTADPGVLMIGGAALVVSGITAKAPRTQKDATPIARLTQEWLAIAVGPDSGIGTVEDLAKKMREAPERVAWAGGGAASLDRVGVSLFAEKVGVDPRRVNYVPFQGGAQVSVALMSGQCAAAVSGYGEFEQLAQSGKIKLLAIMAPQRLEGATVGTLREAGVDLEVGNWRGIFGAANLSDKDRTTLTRLAEKFVASDSWRDTLRKNSWRDAFQFAQPFADFLAEETRKTQAVLQTLGLVTG